MANMGLGELREIVHARCKGYCEKCGLPLGDSWALHHRKLRSRGGEDAVENFVALHHKCHNMATDSVHSNPAIATKEGFMVSTYSNPAECPVTLPDGRSVILTTDGRYENFVSNNGR